MTDIHTHTHKTTTVTLSAHAHRGLIRLVVHVSPTINSDAKTLHVCKQQQLVYDIFESLKLDKGEWVENISKDETSIKEFLASVDESIREKIGVNFLKGLNNKTKLTIYKSVGGKVKFKHYLNGWVIQELVYSFNYVLGHMDLMRNWVDIEVEKISVCVNSHISMI